MRLSLQREEKGESGSAEMRNLEDKKCHLLQFEIVPAVELETNLEVNYK